MREIKNAEPIETTKILLFTIDLIRNIKLVFAY